MSEHDQFRIHLSLVSHTNIGKTTLARTLLMRDVGEVADRAHVTETTDDYVLARDSAGCELVLWDTPGFGNSVALAKRLAGRSNPIGWFLSEIWDRMTNKAFWLNQRAIKHVRDVSSVVLYLVNASDLPKTAPYITAEMQILSWINKPVIVLLNQMGKPRTHAEELADVAAWREAMAPYPFVKDILPMDAFARCWVQETALFDAIGRALPSEMHSTFDTPSRHLDAKPPSPLPLLRRRNGLATCGVCCRRTNWSPLPRSRTICEASARRSASSRRAMRRLKTLKRRSRPWRPTASAR